MRYRQLIVLSVLSLIPMMIGGGMTPLLPVYATQLGADPATVGFFMASAFLALAAGATAAGWVSDLLGQRRLPLIIAGSLGVPMILLLSQARTIVSLVILIAVFYFFGGLGMALTGIQAGISAEKGERGKIFGTLSVAGGLGALMGNVFTGLLVNNWGFPTLFIFMTGVSLVTPISALFLVDRPAVQRKERGEAVTGSGVMGRSFLLLIAAGLVAGISGYLVVLVRSLLMNRLGFTALAISSTGAVGSLVTLPLPFVVGRLSDRQGRKRFLYLGYLAGFASAAILTISSSLWHFWAVLALQSFSASLSAPMANALSTDLLPPRALSKGLALLSASGWISGVLGYAGAGTALKLFGLAPTVAIGMGLALAGIILLFPIKTHTQQAAPADGLGRPV